MNGVFGHDEIREGKCMRAAVIANSAAGKCSWDHLQEALSILKEYDYEVVGYSFAENSIDSAGLGSERPDFAIVIGGDGTIISACHHFGDLQVPIMGVNFGKLGYLAHFGFEHFRKFVAARKPEMFAVRRFISERMLLQIQLGENRHLAVNDLVVDIGPPFRTTEIRLKIDGHTLPLIRGDGVIIATPTGSTAYTLSVGGSIIHPEVEGIAVTPKNPHHLSIRPLVIRSDSAIEVDTSPSPEGVYFIVDGQFYEPATKAIVAKVTRFHQNLQIVTRENYWSTLTEKLKWGC